MCREDLISIQGRRPWGIRSIEHAIWNDTQKKRPGRRNKILVSICDLRLGRARTAEGNGWEDFDAPTENSGLGSCA
jgi:hypothetical protein